MSYSLDSFAAECHDILTADPGPSGRDKVREILSTALMEDAFVAETLGPDNTTPRQVLYEDPDMGFCILAHVHLGAKESPPHDHGPNWAIYGQASGVTEMSEWKCVKQPADGQPGEVELVKKYDMTRGSAYVYNEGDLHSPRRTDATRLIRFEGKNMDNVKRDRFVVAGA
jgi:predicted metal-dependent enzyme (double-stranded beta helix superfamily)